MFTSLLAATPPERRASKRRRCSLRGELVLPGGRVEPVVVADLSADGARVTTTQGLPLLPVGLVLRLFLSDAQVVYDATMLWRRDQAMGLRLSARREEAVCAASPAP